MLNLAIALIPVLAILALRALFRLATLPVRLAFALVLSRKLSRRLDAPDAAHGT